MIFDVAVIGGGPAGLSCAINLAKQGVKCALFERSISLLWKPGEIFESRILIPISQLGLTENFLGRGYLRSSGTLSMWGDAVIEKSALTNPFGGNFFVDRSDFEKMLRESAVTSRVHLLVGANVRSTKREHGKWTITFDDGQTKITHAYFLVEATGKGRAFAEKGERNKIDTLTAVIVYPKRPEQHKDLRFYVESTPSGWSYYAPLPGNSSVLAFLTDAQNIPKGAVQREQFFHGELSKLYITKLDEFDLNDERKFYASARSSSRKNICGDHWVAIGDSASTYDPLTGFGVVKAMENALYFSHLFASKSANETVELYHDYERKQFDEYLTTRTKIYRGETRFRDSPFWTSRTR